VRSVNFRAAGLENAVAIRLAGTNRVRVNSEAPNLVVTATNDTSAVAYKLTPKVRDASAVVDLSKLPVGSYTVCASSGGDPSEYDPGKACRTSIAVVKAAKAISFIKVSRVSLAHGRVMISVRVRGPLLGKKLTATTDSIYLCGLSWCGGWTVHKKYSRVLRARQSFRTTLPPHSGEAAFELTVRPFVKGETHYAGFSIYRNKRSRWG